MTSLPSSSSAPAAATLRTGGQILVDQLILHGVRQLFCVPGESYLAVLDALHDADIAVTVCRQEGGAAMMAEAQGKLTGRPGICFVTRGPGATNASAGIHIAHQDSTPLIVFVGQVAREALGREAFQELDYGAVFGTMAKWVVQVDDARRLPELLSRAFHVATSGRPGPVVVALPEDMLTDAVQAADALPHAVAETHPGPDALRELARRRGARSCRKCSCSPRGVWMVTRRVILVTRDTAGPRPRVRDGRDDRLSVYGLDSFLKL